MYLAPELFIRTTAELLRNENPGTKAGAKQLNG
jgi:hypothetical protein